MIRYELICACGHGFSAWFSSSASFEEQRRRGLVECPLCGGAQVEKQIMTPAIPSRAAKGAASPEDAPAQEAARPAPEPPTGGGEAARMMRQAIREMHALVRERADYVGERFVSEARRRHARGEAAKEGARPIWGEASAEEARELRKEGIDVMPLPPLPDEKN